MNMRIGLDVGSTTLKCVVLDDENNIIYKSYKRHFAQITESTLALLKEIEKDIPGAGDAVLSVSGSAGMGMAEACGIGFVQEVYATRLAVKRLIPDTDVVIELGGERLGRGHDGVLEFLLVLGEPGTVVIEPDAPEYVDGLIGIASEHDAYSL